MSSGKKAGKERLDLLVVRNGLADSREKAKALIMEGKVIVNDQREDKPGTTFPVDSVLRIKGEVMPYVGRGGYKLAKALEVFSIDLSGVICMDVGASTGGFTDCMLQNGAAKVYAVDVGTNQLAWKLRQDERVVSMENTNIRYLKRQELADEIRFVSVDVAFISLTKVLEPVFAIMEPGAFMVCLIKPQFEAGRDKVGKKGVVREKSVHRQVIRKVAEFSCTTGFWIRGLDYSPITGPEGNIEYLLYLEKGNDTAMCELTQEQIDSVVEQAHQKLL